MSSDGSDRDRQAGGKLPREPGAARAARAGREREFAMRAQAGKQPGGGVTETFADVAPPARRAQADIGAGQRIFAPLGAPAELSRDASCEFAHEHLLPCPPLLVRQPDPGEVKHFVQQNPLKFSTADQYGGIEKNAGPRIDVAAR